MDLCIIFNESAFELQLMFQCFIFQGLLSVTEELHSLSFEACFTVQGLTIDLEVSGRADLFQTCFCRCSFTK